MSSTLISIHGNPPHTLKIKGDNRLIDLSGFRPDFRDYLKKDQPYMATVHSTIESYHGGVPITSITQIEIEFKHGKKSFFYIR